MRRNHGRVRRARVGQCGVGNSEIFEELCATCGRVDTKLLNADESYPIGVLLIRGLEIGQFGFARRARWEPEVHQHRFAFVQFETELPVGKRFARYWRCVSYGFGRTTRSDLGYRS